MTGTAVLVIDDAHGSAAPPGTLAPLAARPPRSPAQPPGSPSPSPVPVTPTATRTAPNPSPFPPTVPADLVATRVTSTSVTLTWTASTRGCCTVTGYDISYNRAFDDVYLLTSVGNVTTATITSSIRPASEYTFRVIALDIVGHRSSASNAVTAVTPLADSGPDTVPPGTPADLTAAEVTPAGAVLTWSPSTDNVGVTGYDVYRFDGWFISTLIATVDGTTYTAPLSSSNLFYVRARDAAGNVSIASNLIGVSAPTPPATTPPATTPPATTPPATPSPSQPVG